MFSASLWCVEPFLSYGSISTWMGLQDRALELPKEHEMPAKDKYTVFSPHERGYRKGIHKVPKWTRVREENFCSGILPNSAL